MVFVEGEGIEVGAGDCRGGGAEIEDPDDLGFVSWFSG